MNFQDWIQTLERKWRYTDDRSAKHFSISLNGELIWEDEIEYGVVPTEEQIQKEQTMFIVLRQKWQSLYPNYQEGVRWSYTGPTYTSEIYTPYIDKFVEEQRKGGEIVYVKYFPK
jgi:hypothetical protein